MSDPRPDEPNDLGETQLLRLNQVCNEFEALCRAGRPARVEEVLAALSDEDQEAALSELLPLEIAYRRKSGEAVSLDEYAQRFPQLDTDEISRFLQEETGYESALPAVPERLGDYRIVGRLGAGGMGTVYKAVHTRMGRTVALKVLRAEKQRDPAWLARFDREVRVAARLSHPNVVAALDAREQDGLHFLVTEFVEGADLDGTVREQGPLSVARGVECIVQAARGLAYAHSQGVVHRDIKPANLLLDSGGTVKVLDMGLARLDTPDEPAASSLTKAGMVMGTAAYMAPEQARDTRRADARSDIYSLGCTLHYLLTGRPMFASETVVDTILSHVQQAAPSLAGIGNESLAALDRVFRRMVAKEPGDRFQTATELIAALEGLLPSLPDEPLSAYLPREGSPRATAAAPKLAPTVALDTTPEQREARAMRIRRAPLLWVAAGVLLVVVLALATAFFAPPKRKQEQPAGNKDYALSFNGTSSYAVVPDLVPAAGETYTLEAIVTPRGFRTSNVISWLGPDWMAIYLDDEGHWGLARRFGGESYLMYHEQPAVLGEAVHLAGVFRGSDLQLFINGRPVAPMASTFGLSETSGGLFLGGVAADRLPTDQNDRFFLGDIDAARISRGVRYDGTFKPPTRFASDSRTIALFNFTEGRGGETHGAGERAWTARLVNTQWEVGGNPRIK